MTESVDELLGRARIVLVVGPGGVGKTTMSAALGARAALRHDKRVLIVTVDPSRRLADVIGVRADEAESVRPDPDLDLWVHMVDMARSWDEIVERTAPDRATAASLAANRLYRTLTTRFVQSHDYIALDHLVDLASDGRYDLVVIDTPPSSHVLDILDAPERMVGFFDSWLLKWLTAPYRSRLGQLAAKPFLLVADRVLGGAFVSEMAEFFWIFSRLRPGFVRRVRVVESRLADAATVAVGVQTPEAGPRARMAELMVELARRGNPADLIITNRAVSPEAAALTQGEIEELVEDHDLAERIGALAASARQVDGTTTLVELDRLGVESIEGLASMFGPFPEP